MLLVRLMPLVREGRREGGEVGLVCGRGENMGDCRHGALELKPGQLIVAYLRHFIFSCSLLYQTALGLRRQACLEKQHKVCCAINFALEITFSKTCSPVCLHILD